MWNAPATMILPTTMGTSFYGFNSFGHVIYILNTNTYKFIKHFWLTIVPFRFNSKKNFLFEDNWCCLIEA